MLEADEDYILLILGHLDSLHVDKWLETKGEDWSLFFMFLEDLADLTRQNQVMENIRNGSSSSSNRDEKKCNFCHRNYAIKF